MTSAGFEALGATSPASQLVNVARWNAEHRWGFTEQDLDDAFERISLLPAPDPVRERLAVIVPYLESVGKTFDELCNVLTVVQRLQRDHELSSDEASLRILPGMTHERGLVWEVIGLQSRREQSPADSRGRDAAHAAILAAACHLPGWVSRLGSKDHPEVGLAGYQIRWGLGEDEEWNKMPYLNRPGLMRRRLHLEFLVDHASGRLTAYPRVFERLV